MPPYLLVLLLVLPAYAGMIPTNLSITMHVNCAPRVCGDDP